ncbi:MAG TPA: hypothetical protein PK079_21410 [Leptospiraceae bacterium]|nr:hypothetical protein [Leptospiraceae bacterium]HMW03663.1 hypothetical protein [Leptospiraceae bacterium]HMX31210.1 hypothetical protein [Leptospiraceae bacterium]HMY29416.1 hypothetical protein [Leptospiraceae bacterium]HMZ67338.1 hypothetical protein [Leptospiraceae bacterium]
MKNLKQKGIILVLLTLLQASCGGSDNTSKRQEQLQLLIYLRNNQSPTSSTQAACFNFISAENTCITLPDGQSVSCTDSEISRIKSGIQTSDKRTDSILIGFFGCWKNCAILFNAANSICTTSKYPTTKSYREAQKSTSNTASVAWGSCMTTCNSGASEESGLKGTGATYPTQPF